MNGKHCITCGLWTVASEKHEGCDDLTGEESCSAYMTMQDSQQCDEDRKALCDQIRALRAQVARTESVVRAFFDGRPGIEGRDGILEDLIAVLGGACVSCAGSGVVTGWGPACPKCEGKREKFA